jgi:predicted DNA-binding transcriptional regulator YafY
VADGLHRLVNLYGLLLQAHAADPLTLTAARQRLAGQYDDYEGEGGRRTFLRDRQRLEAAGVPLETSYVTDIAGAPGWWIPRSRAVLPGLALTDDEQAALDDAVATVDFRDVLWARLARTKLVHRPHGKRPVAAPERVGTVAEFVAPEALPPLHQATAGHHPATFGYRGRTRTVEPFGVGNARGHWYVVGREVAGRDIAGRDIAADAVKVYRVDRITPDTLAVDTDRSFSVPEDFDLGDHLPADRWGWGRDPFEVQVAVHPELAEILAADAGADLTRTDLDDGRVRLTFFSTRRDVCVDWVLGLADRVEVLAPADLRHEVVARLEAMLTIETEASEPEATRATGDDRAR